MEPTPRAELERAVEVLNDNKDRWAAFDVPARIRLLRRMMLDTWEVAEEQVKAACLAKGLSFSAPVSAEEWLGGPMAVLRNLRLLAESLDQIRLHGRPQLKPGAVRRRPDGQLAVQVFPGDLKDKLLYANFRAEVWMQPDLREEGLVETMAAAYQVPEQRRRGKVALVLGAGNVASIGPMDVLYKLFVENQVCVLKMNPVNEYLGPFVERGFRALVEIGVLRVVYGGAEEGDFLVHHDGVDEIHITGSDRVHDIIVWGAPGEEQQRRKQRGEPRITKRITSELGCVTPLLIVPGEWTARELVFQAENVATMVANNASFNCNAGKVLITWQGWPQRQAFLAKVEEILRSLPGRRAYYPGSDRKYDSFLACHGDARQLGPRSADTIPWTLIFGVDAGNTADIVFKQEAWCGILAESPVPGADVQAYLRNAVAFCNDEVWGTLSASLIADPRTQRQLGGDFEQAVADLRYGSVAVNHWAALSYGLVLTTWGAFPGHSLDNIVSGSGVVHNTLMFDRPQKSVIWGPFTMAPKPPWFSTHRNAHNAARHIAQFELTPSYLRIPAIALAALRG
ncbi:MAG: NAD-dependent aldehyde dehydrogenase [Candidatus Schekmanbacteria bacterium]|nr:NAD-dependent aldehyde dehydrogenase [Candidatus Schekmanbacteria bacterium]